MTDLRYGDIIRESAEECHERHVQAIEAVLRRKLPGLDWAATDVMVREIADELLAAAETGI